MEKAEAKAIVERYLSNRWPDAAKNWIVYDETVDRPYGWVFFFNARDYVVGGNWRAALAGNGPLLVEEETGQVHMFGTAAPLDFYLARHEERFPRLLQRNRGQ